ncbi:MAG: hypothetical protein DI628_04420 [Blastochloris viridis]|uniref:Uncharacterized protein n=1 Tax=Blastochloris viridis TaxID=1079 RepID=A0A6N4RA69_BLAVI|nr:MAG: hypothetical protein DI628_04420 [Blastochloris viridis]
MTTTTTTQTSRFSGRKAALWTLGAAVLALPFMMPSNAQASDVKVSLNFGGAPYYTYHQPVQRVVYKPAPVRYVVKRPPTKVVYVDKHHHGKKHWKHDRRGHEPRRVAYYY